MHDRLVLGVSPIVGILAILGTPVEQKIFAYQTILWMVVTFVLSSLFFYLTGTNQFRRFPLYATIVTLSLTSIFQIVNSIVTITGLHVESLYYLFIMLFFEIILVLLFRFTTDYKTIWLSCAYLCLIGSISLNFLLFISTSASIVIYSSLFLQFCFWLVLFLSFIQYVQPINNIKTPSLFKDQSIQITKGVNFFHQRVLEILLNEGSDTLYYSIIESAKQLVNAEFGILGLYDHTRRIISPVYKTKPDNHVECRINCQRIMDTVSLTRLPLKMNSNHPASHYFFSSGLCLQSYMAVPLVAQKCIYGVVTICNLHTNKSFTDADLEMISLLASYAAITIRNDQLLKDTCHRAQTDFLTGLFNYRHVIEAASTEINRSQRYNHPLTAIMFDVDHFKAVNDTFGHTAGDLVLQTIAELCRQLFRSVDIVCRYGGEEFFVLLPETPLSTAKDVAERLRISVQNKVICYHKQQISITISLGIASLSNSCTTINRLIERADTALYSAKKSGRNRVMIWNPSLRNAVFNHTSTFQTISDHPPS